MGEFNPATKLTTTAVFTFTDASGTRPGKIDGPAIWSSNNAKDVITSVDDAVAGTSTPTFDGSANSPTGDPAPTSIFTVTIDADLGKGMDVLTASTEEVTWKDVVPVDIETNTITLGPLAPATPVQAAAHREASLAANSKGKATQAEAASRAGKRYGSE